MGSAESGVECPYGFVPPTCLVSPHYCPFCASTVLLGFFFFFKASCEVRLGPSFPSFLLVAPLALPSSLPPIHPIPWTERVYVPLGQEIGGSSLVLTPCGLPFRLSLSRPGLPSTQPLL